MAATIKLRGIEPVSDALMNLVRNNLDDYLAGVELLYTDLALPRPRTNSYYSCERKEVDTAPAIFIIGEGGRSDQQTGSWVTYLEPSGGYDLNLEAVLWNDDPEKLRRLCYRYNLALQQMIASNYRLGVTGIDFARVIDFDFGNAFVLADHNNICEQSAQLTIRVSTQEEF